MKTFNITIQKMFFRNLSGTPKNNWLKRADRQGERLVGHLADTQRKLSFYAIKPTQTDLGSHADSIVIFSHPISNKGKYFFTDSGRTKLYLDRGCTVLAFDFNGFAESPTQDLYYWRDVAEVINYAKNTFPNKKIILHGTSFGAFHCIKAIKFLPAGSTVVLENVNKDLMSYWQRWLLTRILVWLLQLCKVGAILDMNVKDTLKSLNRNDIHFTFIACENDLLTSPQDMLELFNCLTTANKHFFVISDATHLEACKKNPLAYASILFDKDRNNVE